MLRVLSKALARHLQKYPDEGFSCPAVPNCVNRFGNAQCQRRRESTRSPCRGSENLESFTPQLEKHLHVKNTYIPDIVAGMQSVAKKRYEGGESRRPAKAEQHAVKGSSNGKKKKKQERCAGTTPFPSSSKCPVQVERIKQSLSKREELRKKSKRPEAISRPKTKEMEKCEPVECKAKSRRKEESKWERKDEGGDPPKPPKPENVEKVEKKDSNDCFDKIMYGWANLAKEMNEKPKKEALVQTGEGPPMKTHEEVPCQTGEGRPMKTHEEVPCQTDEELPPKMRVKPKPKNDQLCYSCIEELWKGGHGGDCRTPLPADSLQRMVKDQSDRLAGKLDLLGQKIEKDIKDMLVSWEVSARKAKRAMEDVERCQAVDRAQDIKSTSTGSLEDCPYEVQNKVGQSRSDLSYNGSYESVPESENLSQKESRSSVTSCQKEVQASEQPWFQDAQSRLVSMLQRVRTAVNKTRALPSTMSQHSNSTISRPYSSTSNDSFAQKKEIEELYGLISAKGEIIAKDIQNRIKKALKELRS
ncbi:uncharacterized protein LOC106670805 isoform X2 [Cimex lectularius]|uniref:Uncharacterized protein n=1 Tax=Cimex lectularius TaxID=79782 RepID=A0A8I6S2F5_CIMLE|nr:uncharacterized protein LOC106670805 isoform X2 [Cimex lectularius]